MAAALIAAAPALAGDGSAIRYGVQVGDVGPRELTRLADAGGSIVRIPFGWHEVQPIRDGPYDWTIPDRQMAAAATAGLSVLPVIAGSPPYAAPSAPEQPRSQRDLEDFGAFVRALVRRYGSPGPSRAAQLRSGVAPVVGWQVWNEPNSREFWTGRPDTREYVELLRFTRSAILRADPTARVVLAGVSQHGPRPPVASFLSDVYAIRGARDLFDVVAVHPYAAKTRNVEQMLRRARRVMLENGDARTPVWVTELGWATGGRSNDLVKSRRDQARLLARTFTRLGRHASRYGLRLVTWFNWRDRRLPRGLPDRIDAHMGLFDLHGYPKPAWEAFARVAGGSPGEGELPEYDRTGKVAHDHVQYGLRWLEEVRSRATGLARP